MKLTNIILRKKSQKNIYNGLNLYNLKICTYRYVYLYVYIYGETEVKQVNDPKKEKRKKKDYGYLNRREEI